MSNIYYIIPDLHKREFDVMAFVKSIPKGTTKNYIQNIMFRKHKPVGGIKVIYQHCMMLKELGYNIFPVTMGKYVGNFFGYDLEFKHIDDIGFELEKDDIIISTEYLPYQGLLFSGGTRVLFMQNWINLNRVLNEEDKGKSYADLGYDHVITCGAYCTEMVMKKMGMEATTITNGIDQEKFFNKPEIRIPGRVLALSRKNFTDLTQIINLVEAGGTTVDLHVADGLTQAELIEEYQKADIFVATGYPEGFSLPPLEAMSCGCAVIGFTGGGAIEFMIDNVTAMVSEDGDCADVAKKLANVLNDASLKEKIRKNGFENAQQYTLENTKNQLYDFIKTVVA